MSSHLRTFKRFLLESVPVHDFCYDDDRGWSLSLSLSVSLSLCLSISLSLCLSISLSLSLSLSLCLCPSSRRLSLYLCLCLSSRRICLYFNPKPYGQCVPDVLPSCARRVPDVSPCVTSDHQCPPTHAHRARAFPTSSRCVSQALQICRHASQATDGMWTLRGPECPGGGRRFFDRAGADVAVMLPLLERAGDRVHRIPQVCYTHVRNLAFCFAVPR